MTDSLGALLAGAIDYAGMFPPASLSLEQALAEYREHRARPESWMLGRFICPLRQVEALVSDWHAVRDGRLAIVAPWTDQGLSDDAIGQFTYVTSLTADGALNTIEFRPRNDEFSDPDRFRFKDDIVRAVQVLMWRIPQRLTIFFELPPNEICRMSRISSYASVGARFDYDIGFKLRCGGAEVGAIPSVHDVAMVMSTCRDGGVFWKATAGLHHPIRHAEPETGILAHGFINLLTAAVMADVHRLDASRIEAILEDDDPWHFRFTNEALTWRELSVTPPQITAARERSLRSFGSCSIEEPWQDLTVLGLL